MATEPSDDIEDILSARTLHNSSLRGKVPSRPPPKVIEFIEPGKQRTHEKAVPSVKRKQLKAKNKSSQDLDEYEFQSIAREVREFGVTGLSRKEKRKYEEQKVQALGGKAPKGLKMPYPMLMRQIKRRKEREKEQRDREHAMGIFKKKIDKKQNAPTRASIGRWVDNSSNGLQASVGKFKAGVQRLSKADLRKIKTSKR